MKILASIGNTAANIAHYYTALISVKGTRRVCLADLTPDRSDIIAVRKEFANKKAAFAYYGLI